VSLATRWNGYWFRPAPLVNLAVLRIVLVGTQLSILAFRPEESWEKLVEVASMPDAVFWPLPIYRLLTLGSGYRPTLAVTLVAYALTLAGGAMALVGFRTRIGMAVLAVGSTLLQAYAYSFGDMHHAETLMVITLSVLVFSPAGEALSVDARLRGRRTGGERRSLRTVSPYAAWPLLLVRWLLALVYFDAGLRKMHSAGLDWVNGYTLQYYLFVDAVDPTTHAHAIGLWLATQHWMVVALSWVSFLWELTFPVILVLPQASWLYAPLGFLLHAGMCAAGVACFFQYMALYVVFVNWLPLFERWLAGRR
jgi:uncharacterized membrane protein YphA (DoxX/SURF4 family)